MVLHVVEGCEPLLSLQILHRSVFVSILLLERSRSANHIFEPKSVRLIRVAKIVGLRARGLILESIAVPSIGSPFVFLNFYRWGHRWAQV